MNIYKLVYSDKDSALTDLITKEVYQETEEGLAFGEGIKAVVELGKIALTNGTFDEQGNVLTEPTYAEGYHFDVMSEHEIGFTNTITPNNPKHTFAGF